MIKVYYEDPSHKWDFHLAYGFWLLITCIPILLLLITWWNTVFPISSAILAISIFIYWFRLSWTRNLTSFLVYYWNTDDNEEEISELLTKPYDEVQTAIDILSTFGFQRLGETISHSPQRDKTAPIWYLVNKTQDIVVTTYLGPQDSYSAIFTSCFDNKILIQTLFPIGNTIITETYIRNGINTNIEAAYNFHLNQIAKYESLSQSPKRFTSVSDALNTKVLSMKYFLKYRIAINRIQGFSNWIGQTLKYSSFAYLIGNLMLGIILFVMLGKLPSPATFSSAMISIFYVGVAQFIIWYAAPKGRDISKAKKKEA